MAPSPKGSNGRDPATGRFARGWKGGGNPLGGKVARLRAALLDAVKPSDLKAIAESLIQRARDGDTAATRVLLTYTLGRPTEPDILERIEALEDGLRAANHDA